MPSRVKTTAQARGLQRCSTHGCCCCDRQGRTLSDNAATIERWYLIDEGEGPHFGWRAHGFDGPAMLRADHVTTDRFAHVCAKHRDAVGAFVRWLNPTQMLRTLMAPTSSPSDS